MSFRDPDPVETQMGMRCEYMSPDHLVAYIANHQRRNGLKMAVRPFADHKIFVKLQETYGKRDAGRIVKWAYYHHKGRWKDEPITFSNFSLGCKWITDIWHLEMQDNLAKEKASQNRAKIPGAYQLDF